MQNPKTYAQLSTYSHLALIEKVVVKDIVTLDS